MITDNLFINNSQQNLGGALYFSGNINNLLLLNNQIIKNKASNISGQGIYLNGISMPNLDDLQNTFIDNQKDFNEIPQGLQMLFNNITLNKLIIKNESQILIEQVYFSPYKVLGQKQPTDVLILPSGQSIKDYQYFDQFRLEYISYNLSLRFIPINRFKQQLYDKQIELQLSASMNNGNFTSKYFNKEAFMYENTTQSFNLDSLIIYFSPFESNNLEVKVESTDIKIPKYSQIPPYNIESYQNYELRFVIKTFKCQLGEFYDINLSCCQQCTGNTYSVQFNSTICVFNEDNFIDQVNSAQIQLQPSYWRACAFSSKIDSCYHLEKNCIGGRELEINYVHQDTQVNFVNNVIFITLEVMDHILYHRYTHVVCVLNQREMTLILIVMTVQSTIDLINDQMQKLKSTKISFNYQDQKPNPAVLIKVISNYLQIIVTITTFQLKVPPEISTVIVSVGNQQLQWLIPQIVSQLILLKLILYTLEQSGEQY